RQQTIALRDFDPVKTSKAQHEQMFSGLVPIADVSDAGTSESRRAPQTVSASWPLHLLRDGVHMFVSIKLLPGNHSFTEGPGRDPNGERTRSPYKCAESPFNQGRSPILPAGHWALALGSIRP